jgi:hypothetical protein
MSNPVCDLDVLQANAKRLLKSCKSSLPLGRSILSP